MLQWMGGSRRKVITSRKSIHKRQKQYFEQRKRQQQTAGLERYSDGNRSCTLQCESTRSLDILFLEKLSSVAQEHKTRCINALVKSEHADFALKHQDPHPSPVILINQGIPVEQSGINEDRTPSSYVAEAEYSEKASVHLPDRSEDFVGTQNKLDSVKLSTMHQVSIIDLLGDGEANSNAEENSLHAQEAHVAFSIEGLGQVETETPDHSPKISGRSLHNCSSPPKKTRRQSIASNHLDYGSHDLGSGTDIEFSPYNSSTDQLFCSRDVMNIVGNPKQKFMNFGRPSPYKWRGSNLQGVFQDDGLVYNIRDRRRKIWSGPSFLDNSTDVLGDCESFRKNWVDQDVGFDDYFHRKSLWKQNLNLEGWDPQKKRSGRRRTETFDMEESPVQSPGHQIAEDLPGIVISDRMWCSTIETDKYFKDAVNHFVREDTTESLSLLSYDSEESCSSTAVGVDATKKS